MAKAKSGINQQNKKLGGKRKRGVDAEEREGNGELTKAEEQGAAEDAEMDS